MAAPVTSMATSYKAELLQAKHDHTAGTGHVFKVALYRAAASCGGTHDATETNYANMGSDELPAEGGYTTGGFAWTAAQNITPASGGTTAFTSWSTYPFWGLCTFTTSGFLIYNSTSDGRAVGNFSFGGDQVITEGTLTIGLPSNEAGSAVIRIL